MADALPKEDTPPVPQMATPPTSFMASMIKRERKIVAAHVEKKTRQPRAINNINNQAVIIEAVPILKTSHNDKVSALALVAVLVQDRKTLGKLLQPAVASRAGSTGSDMVVATKGVDLVQWSSSSRLNEGIWIYNKIINFFMKNTVQPSVPVIHCFSSFFFQKLLNEK